MIVIDFHGYSLEAAIIKAHDTVGQYRQTHRTGNPLDVEFITGHGIIRHELVALLQRYGLTPRTKLGNTGCIICTIE